MPRRPSDARRAGRFTGLAGRRLQPTVLAHIIRRTAARAGIKKPCTAHTLRHTAATWRRQATGDARLVAEYRGDSDLSTVSRYAHVAHVELTTPLRRSRRTLGLTGPGKRVVSAHYRTRQFVLAHAGRYAAPRPAAIRCQQQRPPGRPRHYDACELAVPLPPRRSRSHP
jgi:hypothetical protein